MSSHSPSAKTWTAEAFLATDQHEFGDAWRYELVDGRIIAHAAPSPDHAAILAGLTVALGTRLLGMPNGCRPEVGSGAAPRYQQRPTARIPDGTIRCGNLPRVVLEVVFPSELRNRRERDRKRRDLQDVEGVQEIVELYQEPAAHIYRRVDDATWSFELREGREATLELRSVGLQLPLSDIYQFVPPGDDAAA